MAALGVLVVVGLAGPTRVEAALGGEAVILRKPFNMETLAQTMAGLLQRPGEAEARG